MDWKLEVVVVPVTDVDRAKSFYVDKLGFHLDADIQPSENMRVVHMTPPGSACSVVIGPVQVTADADLGTVGARLQLVVTDIGVYPFINAEQCEAIYNEIAVALLDFMYERPTAKDVLRSRTFVRTLH